MNFLSYVKKAAKKRINNKKRKVFLKIHFEGRSRPHENKFDINNFSIDDDAVDVGGQKSFPSRAHS